MDKWLVSKYRDTEKGEQEKSAPGKQIGNLDLRVREIRGKFERRTEASRNEEGRDELDPTIGLDSGT